MNYLDFLKPKSEMGQPGLRMPSANYGDGLGMRMPSPTYGDGLGIKPPESFGDVSGMKFDPMQILSLLGGSGEEQQQPPPMQQMQIPSGSNLSYEQLLKMYGVQGLLG